MPAADRARLAAALEIAGRIRAGKYSSADIRTAAELLVEFVQLLGPKPR